MGTYYRASIISTSPVSIDQLRESIENELASINQQMSTYINTSEISEFNNSMSTDWFNVSPQFALVTQKAKEIYLQSRGQFDPTLAPLIELWSFGADSRPLEIPAAWELEQVSKAVGSDKIDVQLNPPKLKKSSPELKLDLSAIAKGFAVDELAALLESLDFSNFLIDIGGELRSKGLNIDENKWRVAIEKPDLGLAQSVQQIVYISDKCIATSGSYRNYFEQDGKRFSHIIDPQSGRPITHQLVSASVIADDCVSADGYATTLMVLGPQQGYQFALQYGLAVYMIEKKGDEIVVKTTPQVQSYME